MKIKLGAATRIFILIVLIACGAMFLPVPNSILHALASNKAEAQGCKTLLFIGNSLTFSHQLPQKVEQLSRELSPNHPLCVTDQSFPGVTLEWHWNNKDTRALLSGRHWDYVVLQEQSNRSYAQEPAMDEALALFSSEVRRLKGEPIIYSIMSRQWNDEAQQALHTKMKAISVTLKDRLIPVDLVWREILKRDNTSRIFEADDHHPSFYGAYSAALLFLRCLVGQITPPTQFIERAPPNLVYDLIFPSQRDSASVLEVKMAVEAIELNAPICRR